MQRAMGRIAAAVMVGVCVFLPSPVVACSGVLLRTPGDSTPPGADVVFTGTTIRRDDAWSILRLFDAEPLQHAYTFAVHDVELGSVGERTTVLTPAEGASCGQRFTLGKDYRVTASYDGWGDGPMSWLGGSTEIGRATDDDRRRVEGLGGIAYLPPRVEVGVLILAGVVVLFAFGRRRLASDPR